MFLYQLLKLTHSMGRSKIEHCDLCASQLKEEYPFFGSKKWVSTLNVSRKCNCFSSCHCVMLRFNTCLISAIQAQMEFCLMCGETAVQTITASLEEYTPKLLQYAGYEEPESISDKEMILVLEALDRSV